jgi:thiopeptide-type bacteriocin biosynthesis protein
MYRPLDWVMVRAPLLPVQALGDDRSADPRVQRALVVGAGELPEALVRSGPDSRTAAKLQRYMIRMASRPTPFGAFAGVALAGWGERTDLEIADKPATLRTRPDMGWLLDFVSALEQRADVRSHLSWFANPGALFHADRVFLNERTPIGAETQPGQLVSSRATKAVRRALEFARKPVPYRDLVAELTGFPGATVEKVERLLTQLWEQTLLLTDIRPPLTGVEPAYYVAQRLAEIPAAAAEAAALTGLLEQLSGWDRLSADEAVADYPKLTAQARSMHSAKGLKDAFQTDMAMPLVGQRVSRAVAAEAARAAELLVRLSPHPTSPSYWDTYRDAFMARYGPDRDVPVVELLNPELGLGVPKHAAGPREKARDRILTDLAIRAIRDRQHVIELDESLVGKLQLKPLDNVPTSLDISLFVIATSPAALDAGDFQVMVGPNLGAAVAGRVLGRFADLLGPDAEEALRAAADAEAASEPGRIWAEVTYLPRSGRMANVAVRPLVRDRELAFDTVAGTGDVISLDELTVGMRDNRLVLRWSVTGEEVVPCAGHMLTPQAAPAVLEFIEGLGRFGRAVPMPFHWGAAAGFPYLPRVQSGRIVLAPARWALCPADLDSFDSWRAHWDVPRYVYLSVTDHRLLLDLDEPGHVEQLRIEARGKAEDYQLMVSEALPAPEHAWLPGADGDYISELVVPLVRDSVVPVAPQSRPVVVREDQRVRPLGTDWLFAKLYHAPTFEQDLLVDHLRPFCREAGSAWFFMRYADPDPHIRVRWTGDPDALAGTLAPAVLRWANVLVRKGICSRVSLDTYDREVERYGGPDGIELAEELFIADSSAVLDLLQLADQKIIELDSPLLAVYTVDDLVHGLGLTTEEQDELYRHGIADRREAAKEYRTQQRILRSLLGDPGWLASQPGGAKIAEILTHRRHRVQDIAARYDALATPVRTKVELARSFVHMHANRLLGCGQPPEQRVLGLLQRTRESLRRAPISQP